LSPLGALFTAQFLSAFVDNMILFVAQAIIQRDAYPDYYLPFVQSAFLAAYILLSPWVGRFADKRPKAQVLIIGNFIKMGGVLALLAGFNPAPCYALVGVGSAVYSPAKYGILPFLTHDEHALLRANSKLESFTIIAILTGSVAGGFLSDLSITGALLASALLYGASIAVNMLIPNDAGNPSIHYANAVREFTRDAGVLMRDRDSHYSLIGTGSFWMATAVLRMIIFLWVPVTLGIASNTQISLIIAVTGVGIAIGAIITPYLISIRTYLRTLWYGFAMGLAILSFLVIHTLEPTLVAILLVGMLGGIYIVPMNACLQQVGHQLIGAGRTIAVQNFMENSFMFLGVGAYTLATKAGLSLSASIGATGLVFLAMVTYLWFYSRGGKAATAKRRVSSFYIV
jgi:LPLT family lysophospholipid transporter-like MFS transporter